MRIGLYDGGRLGVVDGGDVIDVTDLVPAAPGRGGALAAAIESGIRSFFPDELRNRPRRRLADVTWDAPLPRPGKIIGAPANYFEHVDEMPDSATIVEWGVFLKASTSVTGPGSAIRLPYLDLRTDYEGELAVVIGGGGRNIPLDEAMSHVYGYTCLLDITVRSSEDRSTRKSFDTFTPMGPWVVTAEEVGAADDLALRLEIGGEERQRASTAQLIYGIPELIAYASSVMTLEPGDVIATGTPAGVGPLEAGDAVRLEIERVGVLEVTVTAAGAIPYAERPGPRTALRRN